jgi:hypothetical protein
LVASVAWSFQLRENEPHHSGAIFGARIQGENAWSASNDRKTCPYI